MIHLSDIIENEPCIPDGFGLIVFGELAQEVVERIREENNFLEGLCPERILLNEDWFIGLTDIKIEPAKAPHTSYAYYPNEYIQGKPWTPSCTSFAIFTIAYKLLTGKLPYIGKIPGELLSSKEGLNYIKRSRKENMLDLSDIPPTFAEFFTKGLARRKKDRYNAIGDTADEFRQLCDKVDKSEIVDSKPEDFSLFQPSLTITSDFTLDVHVAKEGGLDDLAGLYDLKQYLRDGVLAILKNPEKAKKYKLTIPNGLLLYGPPGCGKTAVAKKFAAECRMNYAIINSQDIASTLVHGTQRIVGQLFKQAAVYAPIILIFDEIETMVPNRNNPDNIKVAEDTNAFLSELNTCAERSIFVIGTTNRPQFMDSAILRSGRFDKKFYVPLPDEETRTLIFQNYLHDRPIDELIDYQQLGKLTTSGYISSDIRQICDEAATRAFNEDAIITQDLIEQVIHDGHPTVPKNELRSYEDSRRYIEPAAKYNTSSYQIGFR